ncbi:alpha/beta fold hydrolase [Streptomyces meridianus]|uniref:Alpha/beta hydrolase n=1 Tax=Streptomyces meridianus TaxID=2938945 RepID=A0ABT0XBB4_9ACTN|nr:alpha/beta hydrolase [Streptomyces meridianus]MCM2579094.1 alpha/beta hydrolase [Streptomyces meridianus]
MSRLTHVARGPYSPPVARQELAATSADGSRLHIEVHGPEGAPAVVLAHGWTCSTAFWAAVVRDLAEEHRVVVYDQRGHGRSPAPAPGGYSTQALADDLEAVLAATLEPGERAVLAGHSMGAMTIMAAADRPTVLARAAAAVLCSTGSSRLLGECTVVPLRSAGASHRVHRALLGSSLPLGPVTPLARKILKYATMGRAATPEMVDACARIVHACPRKVRAAWAEVLAELDLDSGVRQLSVPTVVVAGTADRLTPVAHARRIAEALPESAGLVELEGLGHMTPVEASGEVSAVIRRLVREHLTSASAHEPADRAGITKTDTSEKEAS